jgi:hypothetical protein
MIHIDTTAAAPDPDWLRRANDLTERLKAAANAAERNRLIDANSRLWTEIRDWLLELSHGKCWYSEAKELCSFYDIDHFRPKKQARNLDGTVRGGYWWLAFDWRNYRVAGSVCNRPNKSEDGEARGKADAFPLLDRSPVAGGPEDDISAEIIYLLDPADPDDPILMTFNEAGEPVSASSDRWSTARVELTIKLFHLDHQPLIDARKKVWTRCRLLLNRIQSLMHEQGNVVSAVLKRELKSLLTDLRALLRSEAELAGTARACLMQSGYGWAQRLVETAR